MRRGLFFLILLAILGTEGRAEGVSVLRSLMTGDDSRGWQAVGRLNIGANSFCTGSLIAPDLVLTAAHCMFDKETGARVPDREIEFLADWRAGRAAAYRGVRRSLVHPDFTFTGDDFADRVAHDVALLELDQPVKNTTIIPFAVQPTAADGDEVGVVSYAHNRADSPSLQEVCHVLAQRGGSLVLSCEVDFGSSGAPVFAVRNGQPEIVSLVSAKAEVRGTPVALGTNLRMPLNDLMVMLEQGDGVFHKTEPVVRRLSVPENRSSTGAKFLRP